MNSKERREKIVDILKESTEPINGSKFSEILNVSRQVIVNDISFIKLSGKPILSTNKGYLLEKNDFFIKQINCKHSKDLIEDELTTIVDEGATILDVSIFHDVYGEISVDLNISSRRDVKDFLNRCSTNLELSSLTKGVHNHKIKCKDIEHFNSIKSLLKEKNILI